MAHDVIIIGGGIGGLTCGTFLAKNGMNTLIIEQHTKPGGYVTSYQRKDFLFDVVHVIGGLRKGAPIEKVFSHLGLDKKVNFIEVDKVFRFVYPDVTVDCYTDIEKYKQQLINNFPHEHEGIQRCLETMKNIWNEILASDYKPNFLQLLSYPFRFPHLVKYQKSTFKDFLKKFIQDNKLKEILGSGWGYLGLNNSRISALYMIGLYMSYHTGGAWYPKGGYQSMSNAFADRFQEFGGSLRIKTRVKKILVEANRAIGVELEDGEKISASRVISNADTKKTFLNLVGEEKLSTKMASKIKGLQQSVSGFVVHLGVKMEIPRELHCGCIMYFPDYGIAENNFALASINKIETNIDKLGFGLSIASLKSPELAPPECHALDIIYMPAPYNYRNNWMKDNRENYDGFKRKVADNLILAAEKLIPGLSKHIVVKDISTPLTYERYTSATEGGWYDGACTPGQSLLKRMPTITPIKNLYLTGAKAFPGPGMFGAIQSGLFTADTILGKQLSGGKYLLNVKGNNQR